MDATDVYDTRKIIFDKDHNPSIHFELNITAKQLEGCAAAAVATLSAAAVVAFELRGGRVAKIVETFAPVLEKDMVVATTAREGAIESCAPPLKPISNNRISEVTVRRAFSMSPAEIAAECEKSATSQQVFSPLTQSMKKELVDPTLDENLKANRLSLPYTIHAATAERMPAPGVLNPLQLRGSTRTGRPIDLSSSFSGSDFRWVPGRDLK